MKKDARIFVAGSSGLAGSAITRRLKSDGYRNLLLPDSSELDLTSQEQTEHFFRDQKPEYVFLAAAKVGGIHANNSYPADFIRVNLAIEQNIIHQSWLSGVKRLLFLGSSCIYPKFAPQPIREEALLTGALESTNEPYAIAKIAGVKMCESYNRQYGTRFMAVMPTNLYGPFDNFDPLDSHLLPALIRRFYEAASLGLPEVSVWGSGTPRRELLYSDDMADGCLFIMNLRDEELLPHFFSYPTPCFVNLGTGEDAAISEIAEIVREITGFKGKIVFDTSKPDGTPRKLLDVSRMNALGWRSQTALREGIEKTCIWYRENRFRQGEIGGKN